MAAYTKRIWITLSMVLIITFLVTIFGVYLPMSNEIETNSIEQFSLLAQAKTNTFVESIEKNLQAAKSIESRSAIKNEIVEYISGGLSLKS